MDKAYEAQTHDQKWQKFWMDNELFKPEVVEKLKHKTGKQFVIPMPPPNVTGVLHQGHALMLALEDTLTRWHRMLGDETLYLPGTDHASIAVNMQVVKSLQSKGIDYRSLGREGFLEESWKWIHHYRPRIIEQIQCLGVSCDWSRLKFTMDEDLNHAVLTAFVELHKRGLVYRAEKLVNWSPAGQTGLSDLEVKFEERDGFLWHIKYPIVGSHDFVVVATTRPETLLGDTAVAVHPDDERYKKFVGKKVRLPFTEREILVIADSFVEKDFGSGVVKVTPAHDHADFEVGERHQLEKIVVLSKTGTIVKGLPGEAAQFEGLDRFEARKKIVALLESRGLLVKTEKHKNRVGVSERWGDVVEPYLSHQWFLKMKDMGLAAQKTVENGELQILPTEFRSQFLRWMENIHDWCISRQLWWGQQIPAFHCQKCSHIEVAIKAPSSCSKCGAGLVQDEDVLDTWFSSALWPFSTVGWPNTDSKDFKKFYPATCLETGFDILFFWVARMVMVGLELTGKLPFKHVYMHPMVRDEDGQKMSKTKGNVIDPLDLIKNVGADTLRLTLNALAVQGRDLRLSDQRIETYRNFINKLWNAVKFSLMDEKSMAAVDVWRMRPQPQTLHDRWILSRLDATARELNKAWSEFRMAEAAELLYHFVWNDTCDWYLESVKTTRDESRSVLLYLVSEILKMLHPIIPHVTEELWHELPGTKSTESLSLQVFPLGEAFADTDALAEFGYLQEMVSGIRTLRSEAKVPPGKKISVFVNFSEKNAKSHSVLKACESMFLSLAKVEKIYYSSAPGDSQPTKVVVRALEAGSNIEIEIPLTELVDIEEEKKRLQKEIENLSKFVAVQEQKLSNEVFVSRAPKEVIDKEKIKLAEAKSKLLITEKTYSEIAGS